METKSKTPKVSLTLLSYVKEPYTKLAESEDQYGTNCIKLVFSQSPGLMMHIYADGTAKVAGTTKSGKVYTDSYETVGMAANAVSRQLSIWRAQGLTIRTE